jgi:para-nitrobenzyl esterase
MMIGVNSLEGVLMSMLSPPQIQALLERYDARELLALYGDQPPPELARHVWEDSLVYEPTRQYLRAAAAQVPAVYSYHFDYVATALSQTLPGAPHATDINYVFHTLPTAVEEMAMPGFVISEADRSVADLVSGYWVQFAKSGDPNGADRPFWPPFWPSSEITLELASPVPIQKDFLKQRLDFYSQLKQDQ